MDWGKSDQPWVKSRLYFPPSWSNRDVLFRWIRRPMSRYLFPETHSKPGLFGSLTSTHSAVTDRRYNSRSVSRSARDRTTRVQRRTQDRRGPSWGVQRRLRRTGSSDWSFGSEASIDAEQETRNTPSTLQADSSDQHASQADLLMPGNSPATTFPEASLAHSKVGALEICLRSKDGFAGSARRFRSLFATRPSR